MGAGAGKVERWKGGKVERWKGGKVERWKGGKVERWRGGGMLYGGEKWIARRRPAGFGVAASVFYRLLRRL